MPPPAAASVPSERNSPERNSPEPDSPEPDWPEPVPSLPRWLPSLVIAVVFALVASGLYAMSQVGRGTQAASSAYLPADGVGWNARVTTVRGSSGSGGGRQQTGFTFNESARLGGIEASQTVSTALGTRLLAPLEATSADSATQVWRVTSVELGSGAGAAPAGTAQRSRMYRVDRGVELLADSGPGGSDIFEPGVRELPADPHPGDAWSSTGTAGPGLTYRADMRARAADAGCLAVIGRMSFTGPGASSVGPRQLQRTWCPGRGLVSAIDQMGSGRSAVSVTEAITTTATTATGIAPPSLADSAFTAGPWAAPQGWSRSDHAISVAEPGTGGGPLPVRPVAMAPVVLASGQLVRAVRQGRDLLVLDPPAGEPGSGGTSGVAATWRVVHRLHPGADPTVLAAYGDVVVVGGTDRALTAYTATGRRLWRLSLDDTVSNAPARSGSVIVAVTAAGSVFTIDLLSGRLRWRASTGSDVSAAPVATTGEVILADRSGTLSALRISDGSLLWQHKVDQPSQLETFGSLVIVVDGSNLDARNSTTGALVWRQILRGSWRATAVLADRVVVATTQQSFAVDTAGRLRWRRHGYDTLVGDGVQVAGLSDETLEVIGADGSVRRTYPATIRNGETRQLLRYGPGLLVCSTVYTDVGGFG